MKSLSLSLIVASMLFLASCHSQRTGERCLTAADCDTNAKCMNNRCVEKTVKEKVTAR